MSQHLVNLVEERIDVAIRVGDLEDSELRFRQIGTTTAIVVASTEYLRIHGTPKTPAELEGRPCIASDAVIDDPSTGERLDGQAGVRDYIERFFIGFRTVTLASPGRMNG